MICPVIIFVLSLSLLLAMIGLYFLSYVRREGLGWLSRTVGYVTVSFSIIVFLVGITAIVFSGDYRLCRKHNCSKHLESPYNMKRMCCKSCCNENQNQEFRVYRYSNRGDSLKGDKTIVRNKVETSPR
jgi:hypothetical protein